MVHPCQAHPLGDHPKAYAMILLTRVGRVTGAVQMQDHVVSARPFGDGLDRGVTDDQVDHDDHAAQLLGELGALVHVLHRGGGDVEVMAFHFAAGRRGAAYRLHAEEEAVAPVHERLRVYVLVVFGEVQAAAQRLVHDTTVVLAGKPQLRFDRGAEQRAAELIQALALHHDPGRWPVEGLDVGNGEAHVFETECLDRLEAEHVADDRGGQVGNGAGLEKIEVVGDIGKILVGLVRNRIHAIGLAAIEVAGGETVGPDHGPGGC